MLFRQQDQEVRSVAAGQMLAAEGSLMGHVWWNELVNEIVEVKSK